MIAHQRGMVSCEKVPTELEKVRKVIFTLGSSTREPEEFLSLLKQYSIETVLDVRRFPTSRFEHFKRENLGELLERNGFHYVYLGDALGGYRDEGYESYARTDQFKAALNSLEEIAWPRVSAIMCAEKLPWRCHRRWISLYLESRGWRVIHLIDRDRAWVGKRDER